MAKFRIIATDDRHHRLDEERAVLAPVGGEVVVVLCTTPAEVVAAAAEADGVLCDLAPMPAEVMPALRRCRVISRYGVGCDNVNIAAAAACGIWVANVPDYCVEDVSDHTIGLLLACMRRLPLLDREVRAGHWNVASKLPIFRLLGKAYGLVGYGLISRAVHRKLQGFQLRHILVYDPFVSDEVIRAAGGIKVELDELCEQADAISVHVPLNDKTRGLIGRSHWRHETHGGAHQRGPRPRGGRSGVGRRTPPEPADDCGRQRVRPGSLRPFQIPYWRIDNVVLSDHAGFFSRESVSELKTKVAQNIAEVLCGRPPVYPVNRPVVR